MSAWPLAGSSAGVIASPPHESLHMATWVSSPDGSWVSRGNIL